MAEVLTSTKDMSREDWLHWRQKGIGGSDIAAIAGLNKWKSPAQVYMEKIDEVPEMTNNEEAMYWGDVMEDVVLKEFANRSGIKTRKRNAIIQHPQYPYMLANVDSLVVGKHEGVEAKTASEYVKDQWEGDEIPTPYLLQCQWYMAVLNYDAWWIAVLIGGNKFVYKKIERDEELIEQLIEIAKDFWNNHVLADNPPEIDGTDASTNLLKAMYPESTNDEKVDLENELNSYFDALQVIKSEMDDLTQRKKEYENKIKEHLGEHEEGSSNRFVAKWKTVNSTNFDKKKLKQDYPDLYEQYTKESSYRRFTFKEVN
ncbi:YqaJ viral recombinase family nuclease [Alkalibacillus salilacus]|uniref:Phage-type endonuclease n=1 Tax=Alkalibacillus salilacus TaxID=284582 RepID=A0ABT9VCZ4_9BACI|nr:YqaJ viral recombinase family protein [Alkalibacillus salilacus]MDQ0158841.1 putative phage-type endonuclease [Alkalibacillus salilacus]